jgi:hypothetical protein
MEEKEYVKMIGRDVLKIIDVSILFNICLYFHNVNSLDLTNSALSIPAVFRRYLLFLTYIYGLNIIFGYLF